LVIRLAPAILVAVLAQTVDAEIEVGNSLPELSLKTADGKPLTVRLRQDRLEVAVGDQRHQPKALVVHFFQPDCPQCQVQMQALQKSHERAAATGVLTLGVAHRGDETAVRGMADRLKITFPLAVGTESDAVKPLAAGDAMAIADARGVIRFAQVGYGAGDEATWRENLDLLAAGKPVKSDTVERGRLKPGDPIFAIKFDSVQTGKPIALAGEGGRLTFRDDKGVTTHPKAAVGFFSRY
jgi:peroxiredoxin